MKGSAMSDIRRIQNNGRLSKVTVHNGVLYMTGQVAEDHAGEDLTRQTQEVLHRIDMLLAEAGSDKTRILKAYLYVADMGSFGEINAVWDRWVAPGHEPARTTIEARLTGPQYGIEIGVIAAV
jgi:enamine deaminase RidA (YjgF/YER057c/UK114 family)